MLATREELSRALRGTSIEGSELQPRWYAPGLPPVWGIEVDNEQILAAWDEMHALMPMTGCYPVVCPRDDFEVLRVSEPDAIVDAWLADAVADGWAQAREQAPEQDGEAGLFDWLRSPQERPGHPLGETLRRFGAAPTNAEVLTLRERGVLKTDADFECWLLHWELERFGERALVCAQTGYLDWFHPAACDEYVLQLVPTPAMWDAAAYTGVGMYGDRRGSATRCREWHVRYGAELVVNACTMMQVKVARRPQDIDEAFALALDQRHFSRDILVLPDVSVRDHARALLVLDRWFFHWKP